MRPFLIASALTNDCLVSCVAIRPFTRRRSAGLSACEGVLSVIGWKRWRPVRVEDTIDSPLSTQKGGCEAWMSAETTSVGEFVPQPFCRGDQNAWPNIARHDSYRDQLDRRGRRT